MLIFAHRGASAEAPENTLFAIEKALEQQADGIEIDVHQLSNELVVIHDRWVQRTTNGKGLVSDYSLAELKKLNAGKGQAVPTLWEVLQTVAGKCLVNIEIKGVTDLELVLFNIEKATRELAFTAKQFIISSFDHHLLKNIKRLNPGIKIGALTACKPVDYAAFAQQLGAYSVNADISFVDQAFVNDAKGRGLKVFVYTVDEPEDLQMLQKWGVDGVFSNNPGHAKSIIA